jgi:serpin B
MFKLLVLFLVIVLIALPLTAHAFSTAGGPAFSAPAAINSLGIDLMHVTARTGANALISPYSIELALVMTYAGADGATLDEMTRVLHLSGNEVETHKAFGALQRDLDALVQRSAAQATQMKKYGQTNDAITLDVANRLFGQQGYDFRSAFLELLKTNYNAPFEALDFVKDAPGATKTINDWVADKTQQRIRNLIPPGALDKLTRLVLANALYFKAPWADPFSASATAPLPFHAGGGSPVNVPTMTIQKSFGYAKTNGLTILTIPYSGREIQFLIILPDDVNGLAKTEAELTAAQLTSWANLSSREVKLFLPTFKIEPPTLPLAEALQMLGMTNAFDIPLGSANFDRIAPRRPNDYLYISRVFHKTFLNLDENGTEAAAATAVVMMTRSIAMQPETPVEVRVDHPFIFAIQHRASGTCLFLGHLADPRLTYLTK